MHALLWGWDRSNSTGRVRGPYPFEVGAAIHVRACFSFGLVLCIGAIVPAIIFLMVRMLVWLALRRSLCGLYSEGVGVDGVGLE